MADDKDKRGAQNISDLKARLGLKKPGGAAPGPSSPMATPSPLVPAPLPGATTSRQGLPAALTGVPAPGAIPPPPGFTPAVEPAPPPPDPRRDPFAAQQAAVAANLAAFYGGGQLPGDASAAPAEPLERPNRLPLIGGLLGVGLVMLIVGYFASNIMSGRAEYNDTTDQAGKIRDEVTKIQKTVADVETTLREVNRTGSINFAMVEKLRDLDIKEPDITRSLFHTNYYSFEPQAVQALFNYYNDVITLARQVNDHGQKSVNDKEEIEKSLKSGNKERTLGVILDPNQKFPTAEVIEVVGSSCTQKVDDMRKCPLDAVSLRFKTSPSSRDIERPIKGRPTEIVYQLASTDLEKELHNGDPSLLAQAAYNRRLRAIQDTLNRIKEDNKQLMNSLEKRAKEPHLFSF